MNDRCARGFPDRIRRIYEQLARFKDVDAWIQIACPRLSIDWGYAFPKVRDMQRFCAERHVR